MMFTNKIERLINQREDAMRRAVKMAEGAMTSAKRRRFKRHIDEMIRVSAKASKARAKERELKDRLDLIHFKTECHHQPQNQTEPEQKPEPCELG